MVGTPGWGSLLVMAMRRACDQDRGLTGIDRPEKYPPPERVRDDDAVHLAFVGAMLSDVGDPEPIWLLPGEHPFHAIGRRGRLVKRPRTLVTRQAFDPGAGHQRLRLVVAHLPAYTEGQPAWTLRAP
jgi:hypothetical protein